MPASTSTDAARVARVRESAGSSVLSGNDHIPIALQVGYHAHPLRVRTSRVSPGHLQGRALPSQPVLPE